MMVNEDAFPSADDNSLLSTARRRFKLAFNHWSDWRTLARKDYDMYAGDQWDEEDKSYLEDNDRVPVVFNRTAPIVDAVHGTEINNRQEVRYSPREMGDVRVNEVLTNAAKWVRDGCDAEDEETDAFLDTLICGMGWTETRLDMDRNPDGDVVIERTDPLEMLADPSARKRNLDDARYLFRYRDISRQELDGMFPGKARDIAPGTAGWGEPDFNDGRPHQADPSRHYQSDDNASGMRNQDTFYRLVEYQWIDLERVYRMADPASGKVVSLSAKKFATLKKMLAQYGIEPQEGVDYVAQRQLRARRAFFVGNTVLEEREGPYDKGFTYRCITGKRDRNRNYWFGLVRALTDPQQWANRFFSQIMDIINSNAKGGLLAEEGAFVDPRKAQEEWSSPDTIIMLRDGAIANNRVMERTMANYPVGVDKMMQFAIGSFREVSGVNLEMLGMAEREQAGVLEYQRKQAGLTILAGLFANLRRYRKEQGRVLLHFITKYISDDRLIRVEGEAGAQYVPLVKQADVDYDVIVDEAPSSPNQKDKAWAVLQQLMPELARLNVMPPPEVIDYLPLPQTLIDAWKKQIEQTQQDPTIQQGKELQMRQLAGEVMKLEADAMRLKADAQLKLTQAETTGMGEVDLERQKAEAELQLQQAKLMADIEMKRMELEMKQQAMHEEMALKRQMAEQDVALKRDVAETDAEISLRKVNTDAEIRREDSMLKAVSSEGESTGPATGGRVKSLLGLMEDMKTQKAETAQDMTRALDTMANVLDEMKQVNNQSVQTMDALTQILAQLARPKKLVRDEKGRAIGVE